MAPSIKEESVSSKNLGSESGDETSTKSGGNSLDLDDKKFVSDEENRLITNMEPGKEVHWLVVEKAQVHSDNSLSNVAKQIQKLNEQSPGIT